VQPRRDVAPRSLAVARHEIERAAQRGARRRDRPDRSLPFSGVVSEQRGLESFGDEVLGEPIVFVGGREFAELGQRQAHVVGAALVTFR